MLRRLARADVPGPADSLAQLCTERRWRNLIDVEEEIDVRVVVGVASTTGPSKQRTPQRYALCSCRDNPASDRSQFLARRGRIHVRK